jgi:hypothetical protein
MFYLYSQGNLRMLWTFEPCSDSLPVCKTTCLPIINVLETPFAVLRYAKKCGMRTSPVSFSDLTVKAPEAPERPFVTSKEAGRIITAAREPYKRMFALGPELAS